MPWQGYVLSILAVILVNQPLASWLYHRRVKKSREHFLAHVHLKFPDAVITFRTAAASDLEALRMIEAELDKLPPHRPTTAPPKPSDARSAVPPFAGWTKPVAPPDPADRPKGLPPRKN